MTDITAFQLELLCYVAEKYEPDVGALLEEYERTHDTEIDYTRVYTNAESLYENGYLEKRPVDDRAYCYMLTTKGAKVLFEFRDRLTEATLNIQLKAE